jgi:hypothetical protein
MATSVALRWPRALPPADHDADCGLYRQPSTLSRTAKGIAQKVVIKRNRSHPRYAKEDKLIAYEVLFDLFQSASDAAGGGTVPPSPP